MNVMSHWTNRELRGRLSWSNYIILIAEGVVERAQTRGVSHISLAQYSTAHIERLSLLRNGRGVLLRPFIAWRGVVGPLYPHAQTRSTSLSLGTFQNKHVLAQLGTVQKLALKDRTGKARSEKLFLENYPKPQSGPSEMNEMKGRRLQPFFFQIAMQKKKQQMESCMKGWKQVLISNAFVLLK